MGHHGGVHPRRLLAVVPLLLAAGCGEETRAPAPAAADLPARTVDGEVQVGCGYDASWSPSVMADGVRGLVDPDEVVQGFRDLLADPVASQELRLTFLSEGAERTEWRVLAEDAGALVLGLGPWTAQGPGEGARTFAMAREGSGWRWLGGGDCRLAPVLADARDAWVEVVAGTAVPDGAAVDVQVSEMACTSGRDPEPFLHEPTVVETDESVTLYWTSTPVTGDASCQGNPSVERTVTLDAPLGDRALLDGSVWPPAPVPSR